MTEPQKKDIETIKYFALSKEWTDSDVEDFLNFSERGVKPTIETVGYKNLVEGKRWRGTHMGMYEEGVLDGSVPYHVLLEGMPESVIEFMKKEMFKGKHKDIIDSI